MTGKCVVVTGAARGIGRATVARLLAAGHEVVAIGAGREGLERLHDGLGAPARLQLRVADVRAPEALAAAVQDLPRIDGVVANAGICRQAPLGDADADDVWRDVLAVNLDGVWNTCRATASRLADGGRIVAVSSGLGKLGRAGYGAYTASKHGVLGLVKCLAKELAPRRVTVNAVCPGWVATEMAEADLVRTAAEDGTSVEEVRAAALAGIPLGRFVEADEVAALICWLMADEAAAITGQAYNISCGEFFA